MSRGKLIIISAPSGTGKSTIISWLMKEHPELNLAFSISCTSRPPRGTEQNGVEYFFLTPEEFRQRIDNDEFLEYEEVYEGRFYGTLKAQVERQLEAGQNVVFDVDVAPPSATRRKRSPSSARSKMFHLSNKSEKKPRNSSPPSIKSVTTKKTTYHESNY